MGNELAARVAAAMRAEDSTSRGLGMRLLADTEGSRGDEVAPSSAAAPASSRVP